MVSFLDYQKTENLTVVDAAKLSKELREGTGGQITARRGLVGLSFVSVGCMALISLYQLGLIKHLPEPPLPFFDADKVDASEEAYGRFAIPDGFLGLSSFTTTMMLVAMGGEDRAQRAPWMPLLMAGKLLMDAGQALKLTWDQFAKHRALCFWCLTSTAAVLAMLPLAWRETSAALRTLLGD